jgi:hypothetical protein
MLVTHEKFGGEPYTWCPKRPGDFDTITWFVVLCQGPSAEDCHPDPMDELDGYSPATFANCPKSSEEHTYCPDDPALALAEAL